MEQAAAGPVDESFEVATEGHLRTEEDSQYEMTSNCAWCIGAGILLYFPADGYINCSC